jgi:hypothetical protein
MSAPIDFPGIGWAIGTITQHAGEDDPREGIFPIRICLN